mgnify:CR=1 FL=1
MCVAASEPATFSQFSHVHASHVHEGIFHKGSKLESLFNAKAISCIPSIYDQENMMHLVDEAELERMAEAMPPLEFRGARLMSWLQHKLEDQMWSSSRNDTPRPDGKALSLLEARLSPVRATIAMIS